MWFRPVMVWADWVLLEAYYVPRYTPWIICHVFPLLSPFYYPRRSFYCPFHSFYCPLQSHHSFYSPLYSLHSLHSFHSLHSPFHLLHPPLHPPLHSPLHSPLHPPLHSLHSLHSAPISPKNHCHQNPHIHHRPPRQTGTTNSIPPVPMPHSSASSELWEESA